MTSFHTPIQFRAALGAKPDIHWREVSEPEVVQLLLSNHWAIEGRVAGWLPITAYSPFTGSQT